jgi:hypothetical protein
MSAITNVWRQLVQRRLWPVAILLIAALAAVPLALAEDPEPEPAEPVADATVPEPEGKAALAVEPIVAKAAGEGTKRRRVLGTPKNPFGVAADDEPGSAAAPSSNGSATAQDPTVTVPSTGSKPSDPVPSAGIPSGGSPSTGTPPAIVPAPQPKPKQYALHELTVRFGDAETGGKRRTLERLQPLPSAENPVLIYLGVLKDGKTAVFLVDHGVQAIGDGNCVPFPEQCETIRMRAGDTEFFDVVDATGNVSAQYQLDLIKIHKGNTASTAKANASSKAGRRALKARVSADGPTGYRWDAAAGALERSSSGDALRSTVTGTSAGLG